MESFFRNTPSHLDVLDSLLKSVVPEAIIQPESDELQRRLGTKRVFRGHVEVIHEVDQLFTTNRHINTLVDTRCTDQNVNLSKIVLHKVVMFKIRSQ